MAKKLSQPVKKSSAKAKVKGARKVMTSGRAKPAWKRGAKPAHSTKRATGKSAKRAVKTARSARTPVAKQTARRASSRSMKKPAIKRTPRALAKAKASTPVAKKALAKPLPRAKVKRAAKPQVPSGKAPAPVPGQAVKPSAGEIAARLSAKRTEKALAEGKVRSGKNGVVLRKVELTPAEAEARKTRLKNLIVLGKERSYLTYAEINDHLPDDILDAEQIEGIISMINDMGIQVYDEAPDAETLLMSEAAPTTAADDVDEEAVEAVASTLDSEFGRTTDPVRMYMREMGSVELLTREGEIEIAKRIEEGLKHMIMAISACPMTVAQILELAAKIEKDELKIDDVVDGSWTSPSSSKRSTTRSRGTSEDDSGAIAAENLERLKVAALRALRGHPQTLHADARRPAEGRPQGEEVSRSAEEDLRRAHANPLRRAAGRAAVRQRALRSRQHPPDRAQDTGSRRQQGRHAAPGLHQEVSGARDLPALDRP